MLVSSSSYLYWRQGVVDVSCRTVCNTHMHESGQRVEEKEDVVVSCATYRSVWGSPCREVLVLVLVE